MAIQTVFVIDKKNNMLIFLDVLDSSVSIDQTSLGNVLSAIVSKLANMQINAKDQQEINNNNYFYGNYEKILIIIQFKNKAPADALIDELHKNFNFRFSKLLDNYTENDVQKFKGFKEALNSVISKFKNGKVEEKKEIVEPKKSEAPVVKPEPTTPEPPKEPVIGETPIINPMKREAFPDGIPDYRKDEVLWEEAQSVKNEYVAEFVEGMIYHLQVFLSISLTHHYEVFIDFSEYPLKPKVNVGKGLQSELGKPIEELLFFHKNWDTKIPPHVIELVREIEAVLMKFKAKGKLTETDEMPESALPDLEPLPELPPLEEPIEEEPKKDEEKPAEEQNPEK